jgi:hypothetical protein
MDKQFFEKLLVILIVSLLASQARCDILPPGYIPPSHEDMTKVMSSTFPMTTTVVKNEVDVRWVAQCLAENHPDKRFLFDFGQADSISSSIILPVGRTTASFPLIVDFKYLNDSKKTSWTLFNRDLLTSFGITFEHIDDQWVFVQDHIAAEDIHSPIRKSFQADAVGLKADMPLSYAKAVAILELSGVRTNLFQGVMLDLSDYTVMEVRTDTQKLPVKQVLFVAIREYARARPGAQTFILDVPGRRGDGNGGYSVGRVYLVGMKRR